MEWDAAGTFAMFLAAGAVGVACVVLAGFRLKLKARLELERMRLESGAGAADSARAGVEALRQEMHEHLGQQAAQLDELHERLDFAERLLTQGSSSEQPPKRESTPV